MKKYSFREIVVCITFLMLVQVLNAQHSGHEKGACCSPMGSTADAVIDLGGMKIPNVELLTQNGEEVHFYDLVKGKTVAINFIFTTCTTICPPMGANFTQVKQLMGNHVGNDLAMISVSIDPAVDTPERLKAWQDKFNPGPGWTMLTGKKVNVDKLLKALNVYTALKEEHAPILLVGRDGDDNWLRTNGLASPDKIAEIIRGYFPKTTTQAVAATDGDLGYFTDSELTDQNGVVHKFYSDLMKDKVVVINAFFAECTGTCPMMAATLQQIQGYLGDRLGNQVEMLSISVDCMHDTPEVLHDYAERFGAQNGWYFLTGPKTNVDVVLHKLGQFAESREQHKTIMLIGNMKTRLWKKVDGLAAPKDIFAVLESVINDQQ